MILWQIKNNFIILFWIHHIRQKQKHKSSTVLKTERVHQGKENIQYGEEFKFFQCR